jgi:N-acetylmuramoyl-L-alanine amidase
MNFVLLLKNLVVVLWLLLFLGPAPWAMAGSPPVIKRVTVDETEESITIRIKLTKSIGFTASTKAKPYQVVLGMDAVDFDVPLGAGRALPGVISAYRYGKFEGNRSRIVFDSQAPLVITSSRIEEVGRQHTMVVELQKTDAFTFAALEIGDGQAEPTPEPASLEPHKNLPLSSDGSKVVVLDPGHGGIDPGAISPEGKLEKDVVFAFALALKKSIEARDGYKVLLTRDADKFVSLPKRVKFARDNRADLFIALHADSISSKKGRGITFYTLSDKASDAESEALAKRENLADAIAGLDLGQENAEVAEVLLELLQRESRNHAIFVARQAVERLRPVTKLTSKPVRAAQFVVLKAPDVPSLLIELGFLSSIEDAKQIASEKWQAQAAAAISEAVDEYFTQEIPVNSTSRIEKAKP